MAGELGLDIYVLSLSSKGYAPYIWDLIRYSRFVILSMSDNTLATLMGGVPSRYARVFI